MRFYSSTSLVQGKVFRSFGCLVERLTDLRFFCDIELYIFDDGKKKSVIPNMYIKNHRKKILLGPILLSFPLLLYADK